MRNPSNLPPGVTDADIERQCGTEPSDLFQDVADFHKKYGIQYDGPPRALPHDVLQFRVKRLASEHSEYLDAVGDGDLEGQLDGLVDLIYIALGTCHLHGWNFDEAWRRVHAANMAKVRATPSNPGQFNHSSDIVKPPNWKAPTLKDLV